MPLPVEEHGSEVPGSGCGSVCLSAATAPSLSPRRGRTAALTAALPLRTCCLSSLTAALTASLSTGDCRNAQRESNSHRDGCTDHSSSKGHSTPPYSCRITVSLDFKLDFFLVRQGDRPEKPEVAAVDCRIIGEVHQISSLDRIGAICADAEVRQHVGRTGRQDPSLCRAISGVLDLNRHRPVRI